MTNAERALQAAEECNQLVMAYYQHATGPKELHAIAIKAALDEAEQAWVKHATAMQVELLECRERLKELEGILAAQGQPFYD